MTKFQMYSCSFLTVIFILLLDSSCFSQPHEYNFSSLGVPEGLTQRDVRAIAQDEFGYLWIATWNGLNRYNGLEIENFSLPNPDSVKVGIQIDDMLYDEKGKLWLGTESGLFYYDIYKDKYGEIGFSLKVVSLSQDLSGNIWIGTYGNGVWVYNRVKDTITQPFIFKNERRWNYVYSIEQVSENSFFLGTPNGILSYDTETKIVDSTINDLFNLNNVEIWEFYRENDSVIWMASWNKGLFKCNINRGFSTNYRYVKGQEHSISNDRVFSILKDNTGAIWIGTGNGLNIYNPEEDNFRIFHHDKENPFSIGSNNINTIFESHDNVIWIGTKDAGLSYCNLNSSPFNKVEKLSNITKKMNIENVTSIDSFNGGKVLAIGTWGKGLFLFDNDSSIRFRANVLSEKIIVTTHAYDQNTLLVGTDGSGIYKVSLENNNILTEHTEYSLKNFQISPGYIYDLSSDRQGIWIASWADGLYYERNDTLYKTDINGERVSLLSIFVDSKNYLWIGTKRSGIFRANLDRFDPNKELSFKHFTSEGDSKLSNNEVNCIVETKDGDIWIGTGFGLSRFNWQSEKFTSYYQKDGLSNHSVSGIVEDNHQRLWVSTGNGLNLFNRETGGFNIFDNYDGLPFSEFNPDAFYRTPDNKVFFGGIEGVLWFYPDSVKINKRPALPLISRVFINGKKIITGEQLQAEVLLKTNLNKQKRIELPYKYNSISLELGAIHFVAPDLNKYKYKLEKKGSGGSTWNIVGKDRRFIDLSNLSPGRYTFYFTASNCDNQWNSEIQKIQIEVLAPFYMKQWFFVLTGLGFIAILYLVYYSRIRSIKRKNQKLERAVLERTEEIMAQKEEITMQMENLAEVNNELKDRQLEIELQADELTRLNSAKDKFFSVIGHDLKNPFFLITNLATSLIDDRNNTPEKKLLESLNGIKESSENASEILENLLNWARTQTGMMDNNKGDVLIEPIVKQNIELIKLQAERKGVQIRTYIEEGCSVFANQNMLRVIIRNLLSNAVKFTNRGGEIAINALKREEGVEIRVKDSGVGMTREESEKLFDTSVLHSGFGTSGEKGTGIGSVLIKEFVDASEGTIKVKSEKGKGTSIIILLPSGKASAEKSKIIQIKNEAPKVGLKEISQKITILIAEDNLPTRRMIAEYFAARYDVIEAENGREGLESAINVIPDLIISDVMMPEMDGIQLVKEIKTNMNTSHIPIILLTAQVGEESQLEGLNQGADDYITKPFNIRLLDAKVRSMIKNREKLQEVFSKKVVLEPTNKQVDSFDEKFIQEAIRVVQENIKSEDFNVEEMAGKLSMSRVQLHRKFTALLNQKPHDFITDIRLKRAAQLLRDSRMRVSDVAMNTGYKDDSHFRKSFKKKFGVSPSEYKNNKA